MRGFVKDIETTAAENTNFRQVLYTAQHCQLVVMSLQPGEDIGMEVHKLDQFFRVEEGSGEAILDNLLSPIRAGYAVIVPAGTQHNIINTGTIPLKLYTLYAPPNHRDGVVHATRADALKDEERFDGKPTERPIPAPTLATEGGQRVPISQRLKLSLRFQSAPTSRT